MEKFRPSNYNLPTKILWWALLFVNLSILGAAIYGALSFSAAQLAALLVALGISAVVNQHQFTIPQTGVAFSSRGFIVFWGILWLGVPGGVLLAAGVAVEEYGRASTKDKGQRLVAGFINVISTFAAGSIFYLTLKLLAGFDGKQVAENTLAFGWLIPAALLICVSHYLISEFLTSIFSGFENDSSISKPWANGFVPTFGKYLLSLVAAFILHFAFLEFGLYFGLVLLPVTVFGHLGYRLHVKRLEEKTREISEASRIHLATVEALATAIDARDQVGIGHVRRTQIYAVGIGELLDLSADELEALNTGALLHDIGKLAVPDHILNKPGRLTPAETEKMKIHASVGASILEKINFSSPVVPTVRHHHEMWDGSGYPEGLKGENIPLTARIMAIADSYDTLRGARPYRDTIPRDEARRAMLNGSGTQFDPTIVNVFLRNLAKLETEVIAQGLSYAHDKRDALDILHNTHEGDGDQSYVEQIKRANREVYTLYELARVFTASSNVRETLSLFVKKIGELVPFDTCIVYLMDESEDFAQAAYVEGEHQLALKEKRVKPGEGATGYALKKRKAVHNIEPGLDFTHSEFKIGQDYTAMASLPLISDEKVVGAVSLYSCDLENYEEEHMRLLEAVSRIAADALSVGIQHAESESRAMTDPMTDLPNARSLQIQFEKETARANRSGTSFQLLMLDLDGFKAVNDTFGHKAGDKLLKELARVMTAQLRDYDFLARYAGDEFVAILPETDEAVVRELCERLEHAVDKFVLPLGEGKQASVGVSIGVGCYPNHGSTLDQIIIHADKAMYSVKAHRKKARITQMLPPLEELFPNAEAGGDFVPVENFIVELDESHIISSAIN